MPGRKYQSGAASYQYGFGGKRKDNEMYGEGNAYDFEARIFDPRLVRWLSVDPLFSSYPYQSPYVSMSNNPLNRIDPTGMGDHYTKDGKRLGSDGKKVTQGKGKKAKQVDDNKAYLTTQKVFDDNTKDGKTDWDAIIASSETTLLGVNNSTLQDMASSVWDESGGNRIESFALASTVINASGTNNNSITNFLKTQTANYYGKKSYAVTGNGKNSMEAAINAVSSGTDYSNGAVKWDGKDVYLWSNHYRYTKAAYDARQGIFVPSGMMSNVMNLQVDLIVDYSNKGMNAKNPLKSNYWRSVNAVYGNQMTNRTALVEKGALWRVVAVHGHSTFYSEISLNTTSTEATTPQSFTVDKETEDRLKLLPNK